MSTNRKNRKSVVRYSKWDVMFILLKNRKLRPYIPVTKRLDRNTLRAMLRKYSTVYVKPDRGSQGNGVMRVSTREGRYDLQSGRRRFSSARIDHMYHTIREQGGKAPYLVQQGIPLIKHQKLLSDIRIMIQKNTSRTWEVTGLIVRVAAPGKVVTNGSQGGRVVPIQTFLSAHFPKQKNKLLNTMEKIGLIIARQMEHPFPDLFELGLDIALTSSGKIYVLEVNTRPDPVPFLKLKDQRFIKKMIRYGKFYGRTYRLKPKFKQKPV